MFIMYCMQCCMSVSVVLLCVDVLSRRGIYMFVIVICLVVLMCASTISSSVLCVKGMSVVVNVILSLMSVMSPPPALCNLSARTVVKLWIFGMFALGVSLVS